MLPQPRPLLFAPTYFTARERECAPRAEKYGCVERDFYSGKLQTGARTYFFDAKCGPLRFKTPISQQLCQPLQENFVRLVEGMCSVAVNVYLSDNAAIAANENYDL